MTVLVTVILAASASMQLLAIQTDVRGPWFRGTFDDFTRDLVGASAAAEGQSPYQKIGDIIDLSETAMASQWVAHTPVSVALAAVSLKVTGSIEASAISARLLAIGLALVVTVAGVWTRRWWLAATPLLAIATASFAYNWQWNQHGLLTAVILSTALGSACTGRRAEGIVLLGLLVSLKPWLLPVAPFLPSSKSPPRDLFFVCLAAAAATFCALPMLGGWSALRDWLVVALPASNAQWVSTSGNASLTSAAPELLSLVLFLLLPLAVAMFTRNRIPRHLGLIAAWACVLTLPRLVWIHYLVDAAPLILFGLLLANHEARRGPLLIGLAMIVPSLFVPWAAPESVGIGGFLLARWVGCVVLTAAMIAWVLELRPRRSPSRALNAMLAFLGATPDTSSPPSIADVERRALT